MPCQRVTPGPIALQLQNLKQRLARVPASRSKDVIELGCARAAWHEGRGPLGKPLGLFPIARGAARATGQMVWPTGVDRGKRRRRNAIERRGHHRSWCRHHQYRRGTQSATKDATTRNQCRTTSLHRIVTLFGVCLDWVLIHGDAILRSAPACTSATHPAFGGAAAQFVICTNGTRHASA